MKNFRLTLSFFLITSFTSNSLSAGDIHKKNHQHTVEKIAIVAGSALLLFSIGGVIYLIGHNLAIAEIKEMIEHDNGYIDELINYVQTSGTALKDGLNNLVYFDDDLKWLSITKEAMSDQVSNCTTYVEAISRFTNRNISALYNNLTSFTDIVTNGINSIDDTQTIRSEGILDDLYNYTTTVLDGFDLWWSESHRVTNGAEYKSLFFLRSVFEHFSPSYTFRKYLNISYY